VHVLPLKNEVVFILLRNLLVFLKSTLAIIPLTFTSLKKAYITFSYMKRRDC